MDFKDTDFESLLGHHWERVQFERDALPVEHLLERVHLGF